MFVPCKLFKPNLMFVYLGVEHHSGAPRSKALALIANIRLAWRRLPGTNTLAYYENS